MLGDTAVAVHPNNEKLKHLIGKNAVLPLVGRRIPIVGDDYADPEKGTGAVKITPAHDFNDFEVGKRHNLPQISVLNIEGKLALTDNEAFLDGVASTPALDETMKLHGLDRFRARKAIVERLEMAGFLDKIEPHTHMVPHGDRSNVVIEPFLTDQWYVNAKALAVEAIAAVREGKTNFVPKNWEKTYFDWMENIQPWCISRQLWWGHQIPAWYGPDGRVFVAETEDEAVSRALAYTQETGALTADRLSRWRRSRPARAFLTRDEDVARPPGSPPALWPFSTLGWPDETPELKRFYPTSAWSPASTSSSSGSPGMMMMGLHFQNEVPFKDVYIHRLVREREGREDVEIQGQRRRSALVSSRLRCGLRCASTLARACRLSHDIRSPAVGRNNRKLCTKLWNAARFVEFNGAGRVAGFDPKSVKETLNRWIAHETAKATREVSEAIEAYKFNEAAGAAYRFVWNVYCDWYVELSKPLLTGPDGAAKNETRATRPGRSTKSSSFSIRSCRSSPRSCGVSPPKPGQSAILRWCWRPGRSTTGSTTRTPMPRSAG
jgi:valyl-tRNA synthetase